LGRGAIAAIVAVIVLVAILVRAALLTRREMAQPAALHLR
jgi:hypothetical protein